jgi:hypothetical protein
VLGASTARTLEASLRPKGTLDEEVVVAVEELAALLVGHPVIRVESKTNDYTCK